MNDIKLRQQIERAIVSKVITCALKAGYKMFVDNGEEPYPIITDKKLLLSQMFQTDEERLYLKRGEGDRYSCIYLVYGNGGWDVICDYTIDLNKTIMPEVNKFADECYEHFCS